MIAADAESILPRFIPLSFEGVLPVALKRLCASKVVILSSQVITGNSVRFRNLEQNAFTLRADLPTEPSSESGKPTIIAIAFCSDAKEAIFTGSSGPVVFIASIGVAMVPVGSLSASPILTSP